MEKVKPFMKGLITNIIFTAILFVSAGRTNYVQGWIFLATTIVATLMNYVTIRSNSELLNERSAPGEGIKRWDKLILGLSALMYLIIIVLAGLDSGRIHYTQHFNWTMSAAGAVIMLLGQVIFLTARHQNNFFSSVVRIQKERGHVVCDDGLYKIVRHPGYVGMIISLISLPLMLTSIWSSIPTLMAVVLLLIRTSLEDKTLCIELEGYVAYSSKTRYKLIPFIW